ncbi:MAG: SIS domain-containing protein, partial [Candidatus Heimdallarchaeota archaeon]
MTFPNKKYTDIENYVEDYFNEINLAALSIDRNKLSEAIKILTKAYKNGSMVYSCGNGGSAAIANHLVCDHCKLVRTDTDLISRIYSLSTTVEIITAIGNDLSYDEIFEYQLKSLSKAGDVLITISSSGDSENIVRAANWAKQNNVLIISLTGFSGGRSAKIADVNLHVRATNYGVIEDVHQSIIHLLAQ